MGITCNLELSALKFAVKDLRLVDGKLNLTLTADLTPAQIVATFTPPVAGQTAGADVAPSASREWQRKPYFPVVAETPESTEPATAPALPATPEPLVAPESEPEISPVSVAPVSELVAPTGEPVASASVETPASVAPTGAELPSIIDEIPLPPEPVGGVNQPEEVASEIATIDEPLVSDDGEPLPAETLPAEVLPVEKEIPADENPQGESPLPTPEAAIDEPLVSDGGESEALPIEKALPVEAEKLADANRLDEPSLPTPETTIAEEPLVGDSDESEVLPAEPVSEEPASPISETVAAPETPVSRYGEPQADDEFALALTNAHAAPQVAPDEKSREELAAEKISANEEAAIIETPRRDEIETPPTTAVQPPEPAIADSSLDVLASAPTTAFSYDLSAEIPPLQPELTAAPATPAVAPIVAPAEIAPRPEVAPPSPDFSYDLRPEESTPPISEPAPPPPPTLTTAAPSTPTADYEPQPLTPPPSVLHPNGIARSAPPPEAPAPSSPTPTAPVSTAPSAPATPAVNKPMRVRYVCPRCQTPGVQDADKIKNIITCKNCGRAMRLTIKN